MKTEDIKKELGSKERTLIDLHRYITTRTDLNPNYFLMLGAGCSISSGIKTGKDLIAGWRKEVFFEHEENSGKKYDENEAIRFLTAKCGNWYNQSNEYSSLFEKKYDLPRQRRMFVEQQVSEAQPSLGYAYLSSLVQGSYFNTIFTSNFDDLLNESFYQFTNSRPIVCAHDSSISSVTVTSKRPKIIKLHGDYLFDDIKSTLRETESLKENIKNKFVEFSKDYGAIFIGYSGCDRSIMDIMNYLLKQEDYLKNGIYWCLRPGDEVSEELRKLLWKDRVYYVIIEGFDEFFAYHYNMTNGDRLPFDTGYVSSNSQVIIKRMLENENLKKSTSEVIGKHLSELENLSKMHSLQNIVKHISKNDYLESDADVYSDDELLKIFEIKEKLNSKSYRDVIDICKGLESETLNIEFKVKIYRYMVEAYNGLKDDSQVLKTFDKMISVDEMDPINYLNKSKFEHGYENKIKLIDQAINCDEHFYGNYYEKADILAIKSLRQYSNSMFAEVVSLYERGIEKRPIAVNPCWAGKFNFVLNSQISKNDKIPILEGIIQNLSNQNPNTYQVLKMALKLGLLVDNTVDEELIRKIEEVRQSKSEKHQAEYDMLKLEAYSEQGNIAQIKEYIAWLDLHTAYEKNPAMTLLKAGVKARKLRDIQSAIEDLQKNLKYGTNVDIINRIIRYEIFMGNIDEAKDLISNYGTDLPSADILDFEKEIYENNKEYDKAYMKFKEIVKKSMFTDERGEEESYYLILLGEYERAKELSKKYLDSINFNIKAGTAIVNYELAKVKSNNDSQVSKKRLNDLYENTSSEPVKAAVQALLGNPDKAFSHMKKSIDEDYTVIFDFKRWPVFYDLHKNEKWNKLIVNC